MRKSVLLPIVTIVLCAAVLLTVYNVLLPTRLENEYAEIREKLKTLLPGSESFTYEEYTGEDANVLYAYKGETGYVVATKVCGYAGDIEMFIGVDNEGSVTGMQVRDMEETLGLGAKAATDWKFLAQLLGTKGDAEIGTNVDAITGATVTSKAVVRSVNSAVSFVTGADVASAATEWGG